MLLTFGLNQFLHFMPAREMPQSATNFIMARMATGCLMQLVALVEIAVGVIVLANKFVAMANKERYSSVVLSA